MSNLHFAVIDARPEPHAAVPTLLLRVCVRTSDGGPVHAVVLRCQIRIEPQRRGYQPKEEERLYDLFGATPQWGESLRPFLWTHVATTVSGFTGSTEFDLPIECSYDFEVAGVKYLHALAQGEIPLILLFSGTVFTPGERGFAAEPISWNSEAAYRLPVEVWRNVMDRYFPNSGWLRLSRDTLDRLQRFKTSQAVPTWDQAIDLLFKHADEDQ